MKVKICGITNLVDALDAVEAGADMLGFILYPPSPRSISPEALREITAVLRQRPNCPQLVGVFVNETAVQIAAILAQCQLDLAQLSGEEVPKWIGDEQSPIYGRAYKALRPISFAEAEADADWYLPPAFSKNPPQRYPDQPAILIDTYHPMLCGGTGETGNWELSAELAQSIPHLMLAGGLTPDNVAAAVQAVRPYAVDVASGVEASPGKKDYAKVRAFIANAKKSSMDNRQL